MKTVLFLFAVLCTYTTAAQSPQIMDAHYNGGTGTVTLFVTDTAGLTHIEVLIGAGTDTFDLYNTSFTLQPGGTFWTSGTYTEPGLSVSLGSLALPPQAICRVRIWRQDASSAEIDFPIQN